MWCWKKKPVLTAEKAYELTKISLAVVRHKRQLRILEDIERNVKEGYFTKIYSGQIGYSYYFKIDEDRTFLESLGYEVTEKLDKVNINATTFNVYGGPVEPKYIDSSMYVVSWEKK